MFYKYFGLLFAMVLASLDGMAQRSMDSAYVHAMPHTMTVRTFIGEKVSIFGIWDREHDIHLRYRPNNVLAVGAGVTIKGFGLNFSTAIPGRDKKIAQYGKTRRIDLQLHRYRRRWALDGYLQRYRGLHLNDLSSVTQNTGTTEYPYFPDMQTITVNASAMYLFRGERVSLRTPVNQQDWQVRSAGSPMVGLNLHYRNISNKDHSFIPPYLARPEFLEGTQVKKMVDYGFTINGGYGYHFVLNRHWYAMLSAAVGAGVGNTEMLDTLGRSFSKIGPRFTTNVVAGLGWNSDHWQTGIYAIGYGDYAAMPIDRSTLSSSLGIIRAFVAYRFPEPRFLRWGKNKY